MNKSQLRRLAAAYAEGRMSAAEYRARRRELIDAVVAGRIPIQRETPPTSPDSLMTTPPFPAGGVPWHLVLGGASAMCLLLLAWLLWPAGEAPPPPAPVVEVRPPEVPRSRSVVESFLARRDFSAPAIEQLESEWAALDATEREQARDALWFLALVRALRDEVKTQKALAGLAGGEAAIGRARRIVALGERLGVAEQLPGLDGLDGSAFAAPAAGPEPRTDTVRAPAEPPVAPVAAATSAPAELPTPAPAPAATPGAPTGRQWLAARTDAELTLQIFAVNSLDRVEQIMAAHPELDLHILATDGAAPRYRVFHGVFTGEAQARAAFDALPRDVSRAAGGAIVKSFAAVREDLSGGAAQATAPSQAALSDGDYTLQLFASESRANAEALVGAFPALDLELRALTGDAAPYRVIFGRFPSPEAAKRAAVALPPDLLSRIGTPLTKSVSETGTRTP